MECELYNLGWKDIHMQPEVSVERSLQEADKHDLNFSVSNRSEARLRPGVNQGPMVDQSNTISLNLKISFSKVFSLFRISSM